MKSVPTWINVIASLYGAFKCFHGYVLLALHFEWDWQPVLTLWIIGAISLGFAFAIFTYIRTIRYKIISID